jgi:hypothetical protein
MLIGTGLKLQFKLLYSQEALMLGSPEQDKPRPMSKS